MIARDFRRHRFDCICVANIEHVIVRSIGATTFTAQLFDRFAEIFFFAAAEDDCGAEAHELARHSETNSGGAARDDADTLTERLFWKHARSIKRMRLASACIASLWKNYGLYSAEEAKRPSAVVLSTTTA